MGWAAVVGILTTQTPLAYYYGSPLREGSHPQRSDVIVLLSHGQLDEAWLSTVGAQRTLAALRLYKLGYAPIIISSGSSLGDGLDQAGLQARWLMLAGVPQAAIVVERNSFRTYGSVVEVMKLMQKNGWRSALVVTSELDAPRVRAVFRELGFGGLSFQEVPEFGTPSASPYYAAGWSAFYHATYEYAGLMLYKWKGWI
jgi:uncharacterized SAM-binding protein YcdF (DUF218 family)